MLRSVPAAGNRNKLTIAMALLRGLTLVMLNKPVHMLFDAWFMRARLVLPLLSRKMRIIGQARRDTTLCLPLEIVQKPQRGRPRTYGVKMTPEQIRSTAYTMVQLLSLVVEESLPITVVAPWRARNR